MELPWTKICVYILTVVGYVYSGWGAGLLDNIREAVISADDMFGSIYHNIFEVASDISKFKDVFSSPSHDDCIFQCPNKDVMPVPNRSHRALSNSCGSIGMKINTEFLPSLTKCCDAHDICYDTCGNSKKECDRKFQRCLGSQCDTLTKTLPPESANVCNKFAELISQGIESVGCKLYLDAQGQACYCAVASKEAKKAKKFTRGSDL